MKEDEGPKDFYPTKKFQGKKEGMVFKTGGKGFGYYLDKLEHKIIQLDSLIPYGWSGGALEERIEEKTRAAIEEVEREVEKLAHGKAPRRGKGEREETNNGRGRTDSRRAWLKRASREEIDRILKAPDDATHASHEHREVGLWAIDTVNANSANGVLEYMDECGADFIVAQETRRKEGDECAQAARGARRRGWEMAVQPCAWTQRERASAGTAVATRAHIGMASAKVDGESNALKSRFSVQWIGSICRGGFFSGMCVPSLRGRAVTKKLEITGRNGTRAPRFDGTLVCRGGLADGARGIVEE